MRIENYTPKDNTNNKINGYDSLLGSSSNGLSTQRFLIKDLLFFLRGANKNWNFDEAVLNGFNGTESEWGYESINKGLVKIAGETINSHTPVAIVGNKAFKFDASNPDHQFCFVGFSSKSSSKGDECIIITEGELELTGWGLTPDKTYLAGVNGTMILENTSNNNFTKVIGYSTTADTLLIIKDFTTINK